MKIVLLIIFTLIIIAALLAYWYITSYIKLHNDAIRLDKAEELIIAALDERYELVTSLKTLIKRNTKMDINVFKEIEDVKNTNTPLYEYDRMLTNAINTIYQIKTDYPKLESKKEFKNTLLKLEESDTKINAIKSFFNNYNNSLITKLKKLPYRIVAKINKINYRTQFDAVQLFNELDDGIKI